VLKISETKARTGRSLIKLAKKKIGVQWEKWSKKRLQGKRTGNRKKGQGLRGEHHEVKMSTLPTKSSQRTDVALVQAD
jgi:hypothetical protein